MPSSVPHHSQLMGQAGEKSWARVKGLPSTPRQAQRSPATSGFGDRVATALGCYGLSPLFLPAAPTLQPDPGGFPGSYSDPAGKGRDRAMRMRNGVHKGSYTPSLWDRVEPGPSGQRMCLVTLTGYTNGRGLSQQQKGECNRPSQPTSNSPTPIPRPGYRQHTCSRVRVKLGGCPARLAFSSRSFWLCLSREMGLRVMFIFSKAVEMFPAYCQSKGGHDGTCADSSLSPQPLDWISALKTLAAPCSPG